MISSASKNNDNHDNVFFAPVAVAIAAVHNGVIRPCRCLLTSMPLQRRRGGGQLSSKPHSTNDNNENDIYIAKQEQQGPLAVIVGAADNGGVAGVT